MANNFFNPKTYTVESVTNGHPDKICDQISDAILDACLSQDPQSRVAVETVGAHGIIFVGGEVTTKADFNPASIARKVYKRTGYKDKVKILTNIIRQSPDISQGVNTGGAGDQGIMYGYATDETPEFLPRGVVFVHNLVKKLKELREAGSAEWLMPDGKAQITMIGNKVETVLVSTQHKEWVNQKEIYKFIKNNVIRPVIGNALGSNILVNPTGRFVLGGFIADTGLTGRKIMVDTYGGLIPHGGGCFSGKDPTKVDRSGAYMCRYVAKNIVAKGLAKKCLVSVSYAIGKAEPLMIEAFDEKGKGLSTYVKNNYDFRPLSIIERLNLRRPIYFETATFGHFGRDGFPWEEIT
jgi:S-adenosylmethionine synthetase